MADDGPLSQADIDALTSGLLGGVSTGVDPAALRPEVDAIMEQGSSVVGTLLNRKAVMAVNEIKDATASGIVEGIDGEGLIVRLAMERGLPGELCLIFKKETAALLCGLMMGGDGSEPFKDEDLDALNEFGNQFMGSVCTMLGSHFGMSVSPAQAQTSAYNPDHPPFELDGAALVLGDLSLEGSPDSHFQFLFSSALASKLSGFDSGSSSGPGESPSDPNPMANLGGYDTSLARNLEDSPPNIQMLLDINLNVTIELGRTRLSIRKILELGPGSIIELDRLAGEPVDLLVNDKIVAKGEVVVVDEYFGIRIISLVSPEERIKQLK
jgi:flagellar motor switch protein FliN